MNLQHYTSKLEKSEEFKKFKKEDPKAFVCSAFFIRDFDGKHNESQIDFYSKKAKKIISFNVHEKTERISLEKKPVNILHKKFTPTEIEKESRLDIDQLKEIILDEMHNRGLTDKIKKLIAVFQEIDGKLCWNCTCFLDGMNLLQTHVEDENESVLFMEKKLLSDIIIPVQKGEKIEDVLKRRNELKKFDIEKAEGNNAGFIG